MRRIPEKGDIFLVCLDPVVGTEINKTRPGVIVSNNIGNRFSSRVIVAPVTSNVKNIFPFQVYIDDIVQKPSKILVDQIRTVDKIRLVKYFGQLCAEKLIEIDNSLKIVFDI
ncbi:MAG: type II toxin-antitoxin system PemK/MazF family toxin [Candidatus Muiribacteriaceae bacterium]